MEKRGKQSGSRGKGERRDGGGLARVSRRGGGLSHILKADLAKHADEFFKGLREREGLGRPIRPVTQARETVLHPALKAGTVYSSSL